MKFRAALLLGAPGSGKGTQGRILGSIPGFFHCACGDVFRNLSAENPMNRVFMDYSKRGQLVPDEQTVLLWRQAIGNAIRAGRFCPDRDVLVLDGIPRCLPQAEILSDTIEVLAIFYLNCPDPHKLLSRIQRRALKENRNDDIDVKVIEQRLETYEKATKPLLQFYGSELVRCIDATQSPVEVSRDVLEHACGLREALYQSR